MLYPITHLGLTKNYINKLEYAFDEFVQPISTPPCMEMNEDLFVPVLWETAQEAELRIQQEREAAEEYERKAALVHDIEDEARAQAILALITAEKARAQAALARITAEEARVQAALARKAAKKAKFHATLARKRTLKAQLRERAKVIYKTFVERAAAARLAASTSPVASKTRLRNGEIQWKTLDQDSCFLKGKPTHSRK